VPAANGTNGWVSVSVGGGHVLALRADGSLWGWGNNGNGQVGDATSGNTRLTPVPVSGAATWKSVAAGNSHSLGVRTDGSLWGWGQNSNGTVGDGTFTDRNVPTRSGSLSGWGTVAASGHSTAEQACRALWGWGYAGQGALGTSLPGSHQPSPVRIYSPSALLSISPGTTTIGGSVTVTGFAIADIATLTVNGAIVPPANITASTATSFTFVVPGGAQTSGTITAVVSCGNATVSIAGPTITQPQVISISPAVGGPGTVLTLNGNNLTGATSITFNGVGGPVVTTGFTVNGAGTQITGVVVPNGVATGAVRVTTTALGYGAADTGFLTIPATLKAGDQFTASIHVDGTLWTNGLNNNGQLGDNSTTQRNSPVQVPGTTWQSVAAGNSNTLAIKADGTLWGWGWNAYGQLGDGTQTQRLAPVQSGPATNWVSVATSQYNTAAVRADGTLWAGGWNGYGQIGDGTTTDRNAGLVQVGSSNAWVSVALGQGHTVALRGDGTLWTWGSNGNGQLGDGTYANRSLPTQVGTATNWVSVSAGYAYTVAIRADGTLWGWGWNGFGQLGDGTTTQRNAPVQIGPATGWATISAGQYHLLAVRADGTLWGCGRNTDGQLGDGSTTNRSTLVQGGLAVTGWANAAAASGTHSAVEQACRGVWTMGYNGQGQLGDGTTATRTTPVRIHTPIAISSFSPASATVGSSVTVTGVSLNNLATLSVNGTTVSLSNVSGNTATGFTFVVPAGAASTGTTTVGAGCGTATSTAFTVIPAPTVSGLSATAELPGMPITITGTNFFSGSTVTFGGVAGTGLTVNSATSITVTVPPTAVAGSSPVVVTSTGGNSSSLAFTVLGVYTGGVVGTCTAAVPATVTIADGQWHYLLSATGQVVAAYNYSGANLGTFSAEMQRADPLAAVRQDVRGHAYLDRNWHLTASGGAFPGRSVQLRFFGLTSEWSRLQTADAAATLATLKVNQYSGPNEDCSLGNNNSAAGQNRILSAPASTPGNGVDWFVSNVTVPDHFSEFYLTGSAVPLPVELLSFSAAANGSAVALAWRTANEKNSARFDIERSATGQQFEKIGEQQAQGTKASPTHYRFLDAQPTTSPSHQSTSYYRLRQVDVDGSTSYSPVRAVTVGKAAEATFTAFPVPARRGRPLMLAGLPAAATVEVLDALGRRVVTTTADATGAAQLTLPAGLAAGVYVVRSGKLARQLPVVE